METAQLPRLEDAPARLRGKASWLISKTGVLAHRLIVEALAPVQGRTYHFAILATLDEFGPASQVRIGQRCGIDRSDMHAMVSELAAEGLVVRAPDPDDKRRNLITMTPAGQRRLDELDAVLSQVQDELFGALPAEEREQLIGMLTRVLAHRARK